MNGIIDIVVTSIIVITALIIFIKSIKRSTSGKCNCECCSKHCIYYKEEHKSSCYTKSHSI